MPSVLDKALGGRRAVEADIALVAEPQQREYIALSDRIAADRPGRILDWGSGYGQISDMLVSRGLDVTSYEYDPAVDGPTVEPMPRRPHLQAHKSPDPVALPFEDDSFDAVLGCGVLEHVSQPDASLDELRRVLRPGGTLYVYKLPNRLSYLEWIARRLGLYHHGVGEFDKLYTLEEGRALIERHGYDVVEARHANMLPLTLTGGPATRFAGPIFEVSRLLARVPLLNRLATNVEYVARARG